MLEVTKRKYLELNDMYPLTITYIKWEKSYYFLQRIKRFPAREKTGAKWILLLIDFKWNKTRTIRLHA